MVRRVVVLGDEPSVQGPEQVEAGYLGPGQGVEREAPRASTEEVRASTLQLPGTGAAQHETETLALDEPVHLVENRGNLLHFVDDDGQLPPGALECPTRSARVQGARVSSSNRRVSSRSKRIELGNCCSSSVDLPVLRAPQRNAD